MERTGTQRGVHLFGFLTLSHAWTWAFWGLAAVSGESVWDWPGVAFFYVGGAGILLAGVVLTYVVGGRGALADLAGRAIDPRRVSARWWAVIFLFYPVVALVSAGLAAWIGGVAGPLNLAGAVERIADPAGLAVMVGFVLLVGPLPEEIGWRGYLQEHFQARGRSALAAALLVGGFWWTWHLPLLVLPGYFDAFGRSAPTALDLLLNILPAAVLYAWIYLETGRSVLAAILFHFMENFTSEFLGLAAAVRPYRLAILVLAVLFIVVRTGPRALRR